MSPPPRAAALRLTEAGVSRRDAARLLGVSHQRVQQLVAGEARRVDPR